MNTEFRDRLLHKARVLNWQVSGPFESGSIRLRRNCNQIRFEIPLRGEDLVAELEAYSNLFDLDCFVLERLDNKCYGNDKLPGAVKLVSAGQLFEKHLKRLLDMWVDTPEQEETKFVCVNVGMKIPMSYDEFSIYHSVDGKAAKDIIRKKLGDSEAFLSGSSYSFIGNSTTDYDREWCLPRRVELDFSQNEEPTHE